MANRIFRQLCPSAGDLLHLINGESAADTKLQEHVRSCVLCQARIARLITELDELTDAQMPHWCH